MVEYDAKLQSAAAQQSDSDLPRRDFVRRVGKTLFILTLADIADPDSISQASAPCGGGVKDFLCSVILPDNNCNTKDDPDAFCNLLDKDSSCEIAQLPAKSDYDEDQQCSGDILQVSTDPDNSCGDCNDDHDYDQHCGAKVGGAYDQDNLCGHQSLPPFYNEDEVCNSGPAGGGAGKEADSGCGTHKTEYGGSSTDEDASCTQPKVGGGGNNPDMNCTMQAADDLCNSVGNPSTTSPDEHCGDPIGGGNVDSDQACSLYDKDESCNMKNGIDVEDQSCGITKVGGPLVPDPVDDDEYCPGGNDPANPATDADDSDEEYKGGVPPLSKPPVIG